MKNSIYYALLIAIIIGMSYYNTRQKEGFAKSMTVLKNKFNFSIRKSLEHRMNVFKSFYKNVKKFFNF